MTKYLFKANDDVLSFCECKDEPAMSSTQLDCPWCGCGWLIGCSKCARAFTFAEVRETDLKMEELDGGYFKVDAKNVQYDGYFASHDLEELPHALARKEPELLDRVLGDVDYWTERELEGD